MLSNLGKGNTMKLVKTALAAPVAAISVAIVAIVNARADVLEVGEGKAYSDIATAIGDAKDDDTVLVYDGTYVVTEQIAVTNAITVKSVNGAAVTEVKRVNVATGTAADVERCLYLANAEAVVDGFTFSGGRLYNSSGTEKADCRRRN